MIEVRFLEQNLETQIIQNLYNKDRSQRTQSKSLKHVTQRGAVKIF